MKRKAGDGCRGLALEARAFAAASCGSREARVWLEVAEAWEAAAAELDAEEQAAETAPVVLARARELGERAMLRAA